MPVIQVQAPGLFTTIQDLGRLGFGPLGVSPSGAADPISLRLGNRLVDNEDNAAGLEMTLLGGAFSFREGAILALTGSDFGATLDGDSIPLWTSFEVRPGQTLHTGPTRSGARCYLCVRGGISIKRFLGSASTHILSSTGGLEGRPLRKGDTLTIAPGNSAFRKKTIASEFLQYLSPRKLLRITHGPQSEWFEPSTHELLRTTVYRVTEESNRMGLRLEGAALSLTTAREMITEGVSLGAIQVPGGGQPIILFVEQQTTGGYPKIANVIAADLPSIGQLRPRDEVRFEWVDLETARALLLEQCKLLAAEELIVE